MLQSSSPSSSTYVHVLSLSLSGSKNYFPQFIAGSLDEAYFDITKVCREQGPSGGEIAEELRSWVIGKFPVLLKDTDFFL